MKIKEDDKNLEVGSQIELEHEPTLKAIQDYYNQNGEWPSVDQIAASIAQDHINEFPDYYERLVPMEIDAKNDQQMFANDSEALLNQESIIKEANPYGLGKLNYDQVQLSYADKVNDANYPKDKKDRLKALYSNWENQKLHPFDAKEFLSLLTENHIKEDLQTLIGKFKTKYGKNISSLKADSEFKDLSDADKEVIVDELNEDFKSDFISFIKNNAGKYNKIQDFIPALASQFNLSIDDAKKYYMTAYNQGLKETVITLKEDTFIPSLNMTLKKGQKIKVKEDTDQIPQDVKNQIIDFVLQNPNLDDTDFHNFVQGLGIEPHEAEEVVYAEMNKRKGDI